MTNLPTGTVTFLYTDIEGSTIRWERNPAAMKAAVQRHDELMRRSIETHGGSVFRTMGDAFCASFSTAPDALSAALSAQRALHAEAWDPGIAPLLVRMALHTGVGEVRDGDYVGTPLNRVARLLGTGYGGQTLLSRAAYDLVHYNLPDGLALRDLGEHHLKDLTQAEHIFQAVVPDLPSDFPPLKTLEGRPNNLPTQPTPLIGRQSELVALEALVRRPDTRVVTLTGPGGIGKTRLALQAAADLLDDFEDGVFLVSLAPLFEPDLLASTIAQAIEMHDAGGKPPMDSLKDYLRSKQMLLVLDNFEQIVSAAPLVADLLSACPGVKALLASREVLRIRGEKECAVPPLGLPDLRNLTAPDELMRYDSVALFVQRAQDVKPDFVIGEENAPIVAELCRRLDGLPLAIELAAARIKVLSPQAMLSRLSSRLTLLTGGARDLPARQQTLRSTIAWSYDLLAPAEQLLFKCLSVFVGGFTLEAAEEVCGIGLIVDGSGLRVDEDINHQPATINPQPSADVLEGLMALVDKSLLRQEERWGSGETRFMMLETIQEFARQMLEESGRTEQMRQRHAEYFTALGTRAGSGLMSPSRLAALSTLETEHDNLRAVLEWCVSSPETYEMGLRLSVDLAMFWDYQSIHTSEGRMWLERMLSLTSDAAPSATRGNAFMGAGMLSMALGDYTSARTWLTESIGICEQAGDSVCAIMSTGTLGLAYQLAGDPAQAIRLTSEALERAEMIDSPAFRASYGPRGGKPGTAFGLVPLEWGRAFLSFVLGDAYLAAGDLETARSYHQKSIELYGKLNLPEDASQPLTSLGKIAMLQGNYEEARALLEEALRIRRNRNITWYIAISLTTLSDLARHQGDYRRAETLSTESLKIFRDLANEGGIPWALYNLGCAALHRDDLTQASAYFKESLQLRKEQGNKQPIAENLLGLAGVASGRGDPRKATILLGAVGSLLDEGIHLELPERNDFDHNMAILRAKLNEAYETAWAAGRAMAVEEAVEYALGGA